MVAKTLAYYYNDARETHSENKRRFRAVVVVR